jgi:phenylpropionate dioxygenase-like ring-hydroxylating dioxygenase large terminal subunit
MPGGATPSGRQMFENHCACLRSFEAASSIAPLDDSSDYPLERTFPGGFPLAPGSWYYIGTVAQLAHGPLRFELPGEHSYVAFRGADGPAVLSGRCCHMGADLSLGCVRNGRLACPLHGWEYASNGSCEHIPAAAAIPSFARQASFPVEVCGNQLFFFNRLEAKFPFPFFPGMDAAHLFAARAFEFTVEAPWYLLSANGFDVQHFRCAHDRTLLGEPVVDSRNEFSWRMRARFRVSGDSLRDRLTRGISGSEVEMTVENWNGNLVLVTARFQRTTSYGIVSFMPLDRQRTKVRNIVWVPRSQSWIGRRIIDPLDALIRRSFIQKFVRSDADRSDGIRFRPDRMIDADKVLVDYLCWLQNLHRQSSPENVL